MRSSWKCVFSNSNLKSIKNHFIISPKFLGSTLYLHNGKKNVKVKIQQFMLGFNFGHFIRTKKSQHGSKSKY